MHLLIVAKRPLPGFAKTRLMPAFGPDGSAALAEAALRDTFDAARGCRADQVIVSFDGDPEGIVPDDFTVVAQRSGPFEDRLTGAWDDAWSIAGTPGIQVGMDTPQVTSADLDAALDLLERPGTDAVLGPATDGGWWAIGLNAPAPGLFDGIAMSQGDTGAQQHARLRELGLTTTMLAEQRDVDEPDDVAIVAAEAEGTRFARVAATLLAAATTSQDA